MHDAEDGVARGLRGRRDNGQRIAERRVEERRLANVWPPDEGDGSGARWSRVNRTRGRGVAGLLRVTRPGEDARTRRSFARAAPWPCRTSRPWWTFRCFCALPCLRGSSALGRSSFEARATPLRGAPALGCWRFTVRSTSLAEAPTGVSCFARFDGTEELFLRVRRRNGRVGQRSAEAPRSARVEAPIRIG